MLIPGNDTYSRRVFLASAVGFCGGLAFKAQAFEISRSMLQGKDYQSAGLAHFALHDYPLKPEMLKAINYGLAKLIRDHQKVFNRQTSARFHVRYRIFGKFADYKKFSAVAYHKEIPRNLLGYFSPSGREIVTWRQQATWRLLPTLLHEGSHAIMHDLFGQLPFWMVEGSADWFGEPAWIEGLDLKRDKKRRWLRLEAMRQRERLPKMRDYLVSRGYKEWSKMFSNNIGLGYDVGWSIFDFFMSHPQSTKFLAFVVNNHATREANRRGTTQEAIFAGFIDKHWPGGMYLFQKGWHSWINLKAKAATTGS